MKTVITLFAIFILSGAVIGQTASSLSPQQVEALKKLKTDTEKTSAPYELKLAETVKQIYVNMLSENEDQKLRERLGKQLHQYGAKLLDIRGDSYRAALALLTPEQRQTIRDELKKPGAPMDIAEVIAKVFGLSEK